jgi:hypothetical protein
MTLTTHAVVGSLVGAAAAANPVAAAFFGLASHFLMDSIPHWDYPLASVKKDLKNPMNDDMDTSGGAFYLDLGKIALDVLLGFSIVWLTFHLASSTILIGAFIGAFFAMVPDSFQFIYWKFRHEPLVSLQRFHIYLHAQTKLDDRPVLGILSQIAIIGVVVVIARHFFL